MKFSVQNIVPESEYPSAPNSNRQKPEHKASNQLKGDFSMDESSVMSSLDEELNRAPNDFFRDELLSRLELEFKELNLKKSSNLNSELTTNGLWVIESANIFQGGQIEWEQSYRLKHLTSGKYLRVSKKSANTYIVDLTQDMDEDLLFKFIPVENSLILDENRKYIAKDAFFRIYHISTKKWISFKGDMIEGTYDKENNFKKESFAKTPTISDVCREVDTFKAIKADFEEIWETNFLLSSFPILIEIVDHFGSFKDKMNQDELNRIRNFDEIVNRVIHSLHSLEDFIYNKLPGNIAIGQEFGQISPLRQKIIREQNVLGMLCWLLEVGFPNIEEIRLAAENLRELSNTNKRRVTYKELLDSLQSKNKNTKKQDKLKIDYITKKYFVCFNLYRLLQNLSIQSPENQDYIFKFILTLVNHLGHGKFVSRCLTEIFRNNEKILYSLHKINVISKTKITEKKNLLTEIVSRFYQFKPYQKWEILDLLKSLCICNQEAIYINQDKIFKLVYEDINFRSTYMIEMSSKGDELFINHKESTSTFETFFQKNMQIEITFLKSQLDLYATLCMNRNYSSAKAIGKIFTIHVLIKYINNESVPEDIRAILIKLMAIIHIDKEPRNVLEKPNLVKIVDFEGDNTEAKPVVNTHKRKSVRDAEIEEKKEFLNDEDSLLQQEEEMDKELLEKLKTFLFNYLEKMSNQCKTTNAKTSEIYTQLTFEVTKIVCLMLKFGLFKTKNAKQVLTVGLIPVNLLGGKMTGDSMNTSEVEKLIKYLTPLLEYDEAYFQSMSELKIKRKWFEDKAKDKNKFGNVFFGIGDIGKQMFNAITDNEDSQKKSRKVGVSVEREAELIKDQVFKKPESLKKVLNKFSNKTFIIKEEEGDGNYEVDIKKTICEIFEYIFDMREDFLIENVVEYFRKQFIPKFSASKTEEFDLSDTIKTLFPDSYCDVSTAVGSVLSKFQNYTQFEEIKSFDRVLGRPFLESVLMSFFFTQSSSLQNSILNVLERCCSEKNRLKESIERLELLFSEEHKKLYAAMKIKLNKLKNLTSNAQIWLQIIDINPYQPEYFEILEKYDRTLTEVQSFFSAEDSPDSFKIKQRMFRFLGGQKIIFEMLKKGFLIFDSYIELFKKPALTNSESNASRAMIADRIALIFKKCHQTLGLFCRDNSRYQLLLYENLINSLMLFVKLNIGQMELIYEILKDNVDIANNLPEQHLKFFCNMIIQHGQKTIFLNSFDNLVKETSRDTIDIQKRILNVLLNDSYLDNIRPNFKTTEANDQSEVERNSFPDDPDTLMYPSKLIGIIARCLRGEIGVGLITKALKITSIADLVEFLQNRALYINQLIIEGSNFDEASTIWIENGKSAAVELLSKFLKTTIHFTEEFSEVARLFFDYLKIETIRFNKNKNTNAYLFYLVDFLLPLLNDLYLKDPSILELGDQQHSDYKLKQKAFKFVQEILHNSDRFTTKLELTEVHIKTFNTLARYFKMQVPEGIKLLNEKFEQKHTEAQEEEAQKLEEAKKEKNNMKRELNKKKSKKGDSTPTIKKIGSDNEIMTTNNIYYQDLQSRTSMDAWRTFRDCIEKSEDLKKSIKADITVLSNSIMNFHDVFIETEDPIANETIISTEDLLLKFLNFLEFWIQRRAEKKSVIFLIRALGYIFKNLENQEIEERQNMFDQLNATRILIVLIWEEKNDDTEYLFFLFKFMSQILLNGNSTVQKTIYDFFLTNSSSEKFFRKINDLIIREIANVNISSKSINVTKEISKIGMKILRLLQLFCEGHNLYLQNYLRQQTNSKNNYDLVSLTIKLLSSYKINSKNFESVMQCFDTLTEFIQGPCADNQMTIVNSKFLEFAVSLLKEDEKVIDYIYSSKGERSSSQTASIGTMQKSNRSVRKSLNATMDKTLSSGIGNSRKRSMKLKGYELSRVKYKCLVTIVSLLECNTSESGIATRIMRSIPLSLLQENLIQVYSQYKKVYKNGEYIIEAFGHMEDDEDLKVLNKDEYYELIIENGFNIYILINIFLDHSKALNVDNEELNDFIKQLPADDESSKLFKGGALGDLANFGKSLFTMGKNFTKAVIDKSLGGAFDEKQLKAAQSEIEKKQLFRDAITFFKSNMAHIEVVRDDELQRIYFPLLPYCKFLSKSLKTEFHENVNRSSTKAKLAELMIKAKDLIISMKHDEKLHRIFNKYQLIGLLANNVRLWENISFYVALALNGIVILSAYSYRYTDGNGRNNPHIFQNKDFGDTLTIIRILGVLSLVFSSLVVINFFMKRAPILLGDIWKGFFTKKVHLIKTPLKLIAKLIKSLWRGFRDPDILYYSLVIFFGLLGLIGHPFFFFFDLTYFMRIEILKNVVRAVYNPRKSLALTFLVFMLMQYYFSLIGYISFHLHYQFEMESGATAYRCNTLWDCFLTNFDFTFKNTGAIGAFLTDPDAPERGGDVNIGRLIFDNANNLILVYIIINMVAGIIIDTFGALKEELQNKEEDMTQYCFICGIDRERLDKSSEEKQGYAAHIKRDHYMWNYVYFMAYLKFKDMTEYNGNESYIHQKIENFDLGWFPVNRALSVKDDEDENEMNQKIISNVTKNMTNLKEMLGNYSGKVNRIVENSFGN